MNELLWKQVIVSPCETFHLLNGKPLYSQQYSQVLKFHEPGLAPVKNEAYAFHIDIQGLPAYSNRYIETFGFYEGLAAVRNEEGCFHINTQGVPIYSERYDWCGNFQEHYCPVKDKITGLYFHINRNGQEIYQKQYCYVGDFKDGSAVVCNELGLHTHIDYKGNALHNGLFKDLDVYHKGYARAEDEQGWFHINKQGVAIYKARYQQVEPFYNGIARVKTFEGDLITINTAGDSTGKLSSLPADQKIKDYHRVIDGYPKQDAHLLLSLIDWTLHNTVIGVERNSKVLLEKLLIQYSHLRATLLGEEYILKYVDVDADIAERFLFKVEDLLKPWAILADAILLPKILLSWPDGEVVKILKNAARALLPDGKIYLFEMILTKDTPNGSLLDLNMLIETGGKLRFITDWDHLFCKANLNLEKNIMIDNNLCLFILKP